MVKVEVTRDVNMALLRKVYRKEQNHKIKNRILMVIHVKDGKSSGQVGDIFLCNPSTVSTWVRRFNSDGFQGLRDKPRKGRPRKVDYEDLKSALDRKPKDFGYDFNVWFPKLVHNYILDFQGVKLAFDYIYTLIDQLGYSLVVPRTKSYKSDDKKVAEFKKKVRKL